MPRQPPAQTPLAMLAGSMVEYLPDFNEILPESVMEVAIKFKDRALYYLSEISLHASKLSHNEAVFVTTVLLGLVALSVILYFVFLRYVLRPSLKKFGMEFKTVHFSVLSRSFGFSKLVILPLDAPVIGGIFGAIFPSAVVKQLELSDEYPPSKIEIGRFRVKIRVGSLTGKFRSDTEKSWVVKFKNFIGSFIPRPMVVIKMTNVVLTVEKAYLAPEAPPEFANGKLPYAIPPPEEHDLRLPVFDQEALLEYFRNDEINDAEAATFWIERWINHVVTKMKYAESKKTSGNSTDDEKTNSTMRYVCRAILHSITIQLENASLVISGADADAVKSARESRSPMESNLTLAKLPKAKRALSIIGAKTIEIALSSDDECNLFLCCTGVQIKVGSPYKTKDGEMVMSWHNIVHPFDVVVELKGLVDILIWALNYDHQFDRKSIDLLITVSELALSLSPNHLHTLLLHLDDFIDANSPFNDWYMYLHRRHLATLGSVSDEDKLAYIRSYPSMKVKKAKCTQGKKRLTAKQVKDLEKKMTRHEIMSLRCFAMRNEWKIPKESLEFADYLKSSGSSIVELIDPLEDNPGEILVPFQQEYASPLHALLTLVRWKNALLSLLKIRYVAQQLHIDLPSDFDEVGVKRGLSKRRVPTTLTSTGVHFELEKRDALLHIPVQISIDSPRTTLKTAFYIKGVEWSVVSFNNQGDALPKLESGDPVGIIYKQKIPTNERAISVELKMEAAPTATQDTSLSLYLVTSDLVIVVNPIPLLSSLQTLLDASCVPFQIVEDPEEAEQALEVVSSSPKKIEMVLSDDEIDAEEKAPGVSFLDTLTTDVDMKVEKLSVVFLANGASICHDIIHFDVKDIGIELDSMGLSGILSLAAEPFELRLGQVITSENQSLEWELLPFKPIASVQGVRLISTINEARKNAETKFNISVKQGVENVLVALSPLVLAALNGVADTLQPFMAPDQQYEAQQETEKQAKLEDYRANVHRQRQELISLFNAIDTDQSHSLQDNEIAELVRMMIENSSTSGLPSINSASGLTSAEFNREKNFLLSVLDSKGLNEVSLPDLEMVLYQMACNIDDRNLKSDLGSTGIPYFDNIHKSKYFLSGPTLRQLVKFDDLKEFTAMHHVFRLTGHEDIEKKAKFPPLSTWAEGGIDLFWDLYTAETGCSPDSLNGQDIKHVQQKLVRSLCNYEFAKYCWKVIVQPQFYSKASLDNQEVTLWQLDNDHKFKASDGVIDLLLRHLRATSMPEKEAPVVTSNVQYSISIDAVVDTVSMTFGCSHAINSLVEMEFSQMSLGANALLSEAGWFLPGADDDNRICFRSVISSQYLNTKHDHMETAIEPYPCYGSISYKVDLPDSTQHDEGTETSSFSVFLDCPRVLNIGLGLSLLETASVLLNAVSPSETDARSLFAGCKKILIKNNTGREIKVSTKAVSGSGVLIGSDKSFTSVSVDESASFSLPDDNVGLSFYADRYKMIQNVALSPYQPLMFPLLRRKKQPAKSRQQRSMSGFGSFLTLVPTSDSLDAVTIEARSCLSIQTQIPVNIRIVRLSKTLGYLSKRGMKSVIDLTKKNLVPALKRLVKGALIVFEKQSLNIGSSCSVPVDLFNSSRYYVLLIQDITGSSRDRWRDPVLLTQDYLFNTMAIPDVSRSHSLSGVCVKKERLNVNVTSKRREANDAHDMLMRTAWDTTVLIVPTFTLSNSLPFGLSVKVWQFMEQDADTSWFEQSLADEESESSGDENQSSSMASTWISNMVSAQYHNPPEGNPEHFYAEEQIHTGQSIRLSGINLQRCLFVQVSQRVKVFGAHDAKHIWSSPVVINLQKLRTGANKKGNLSLPSRILDLGDDVDALVDASVDVETGMPNCMIYSKYWVMNKTGMKIEYKVTGDPRRFIDSGTGGLPVMFHGGYHGGSAVQTNTTFKKSSSELSCIPVETPKHNLVTHWWDEETNGVLVLKGEAIKSRDGSKNRVGWSEAIEMDAAGTTGKLHCNQFVISAKIESLAGAFYKTNLITLSPHFILKNTLHISVTMIPLMGTQQDVIRLAKKLRINQDFLAGDRVHLDPGRSTVVYSFHNASPAQTSLTKWVAFTVNATRSRHDFHSKWHLVPIETAGSSFYSEYDGLHTTVCGILEVKVHTSDGGSMVISISHAASPPFLIENRSNTHFIQFAQDDDDATVFELPPMHSCAYTWDSPLGNKRLRAIVVRRHAHHFASLDDHQLDRIDERHEYTENRASASVASRQSSSKRKKKLPSIRRSKGANDNNTSSIRGASTSSYSSTSVLQKYRNIFDGYSRSYSMIKVGRKKDLPTNESSHHLHAHLRIIAGAKILSFNDSDYLAQQVESGIMRKGGSFKSALLEMNIEGMQLTVLDTHPRELLGLTVRDVQIIKPRGSIESTFRVRHFQVDAMLPTARYPIIIQPLPLGVDRRRNVTHQDVSEDDKVKKSECFWLKHSEKPVPVLEIVGSYVPQTNMVWIPNLYVMISPCQVNVDVEYLLGIVGMMLDSVSSSSITSESTSFCPIKHANTPLHFITQGQTQTCLTYLEKLYIAPVYFDIELDIKDESQEAEEGALTLNAIARSTNSTAAAGILGWILNVGANFAHVSPTFKYSDMSYADKYCDIVDVIYDIVISYVFQSIQQSYKVIFSMHLLGDPSLLAHEWKTGVTDLVSKTKDEFKAGGSEGVGKGFASFLQHAVGGTFFWMGKLSGSWAKTLDSVISNDSTSTHLKPNFASYRSRPNNAPEGLIQGANFVGQTVVYGVAGLIGNPYRGLKSGGVVGLAKGTVSGVVGVFSTPFVGALGFIAKTTEGLGAQTKCLEIGVINTRCRPIRSAPWGSPMMDSGLPYLKAIGIRVHCVRYQKVRKQAVQGNGDDADNDEMKSWRSSKELKRIRTAEERRKNPPRKVVTVLYKKDKHLYSTYPMAPKLLPDQPQNDVLSHYAVVFQETIVIRVSDLQLSDEVTIQFRNNKAIKSMGRTLGVCKMTIGDMYSHILNFHRELMVRNDIMLAQDIVDTSEDLFHPSSKNPQSDNLVIPSPQEFSLFRSPKASKSSAAMFDLVNQELVSIQRDAEEKLQDQDEDEFVSPDSLFLIEKKARKDEPSGSATANEKLFGSISLSFFPIAW